MSNATMKTKALKAVRKAPTKSTPKWARTTDGIVGWWGRDYHLVHNLKPLRLTERLLRLFAVACCKFSVLWEHAESEVKAALDVVERYADGEESIDTLLAEHAKLESLCPSGSMQVSDLFSVRSIMSNAAMFAAGPRSRLASDREERLGFYVDSIVNHGYLDGGGDNADRVNLAEIIKIQDAQRTAAFAADDIREGRLLAGIAAPDWRLAPQWRTTTAVSLAREIYESRDFSAMPILADALQDAGCNNEAWLARMRDPSWPWCRGCHVLDSLLPELVRV